MRAIDTNVVVRFLVADDREQATAARRAIEGGDIFIATTVLLETEWVLRSAYGFAPAQITRALREFAGIPGIKVEEPASLARALDGVEGGMDFADALHLTKSDGCTAFLSFDRRLAKAAASYSDIPVELP